MGAFAIAGLPTMTSTLLTSRPRWRALVRCTLGAALAAAALCARADTLSEDKKQALSEFVAAYRLAELWPQMTPKIARDSLPRLEDATRADIDADPLPGGVDGHAAAQARVSALLPRARKDLEAALQSFDADELATYAAFSIYAKYFETEEIRQMSAFFGSDTGRKLTTLGPTILAESRKAGSTDVLPRHFSDSELQEIMAFWRSPVGVKMNSTAEQVREDMHDHFAQRSEAAVQQVARQLATQAEADAGIAAAPPEPAAAASAPD